MFGGGLHKRVEWNQVMTDFILFKIATEKTFTK